ncbi:hypothetical protein P691DRAFT_763144 [Macrolepiota fuliginosa MF-IS2]|uniref:Uncharacterized protein n=1 Tax=Macrolepiota fuliginosa MF-IS2 TaxID=1400762 RepID=A0A9P6BY44_9AGAR|nr:hypothetical protein P691DRAFT_763144 [Macrolepiota fuliginosa MF-IS2]
MGSQQSSPLASAPHDSGAASQPPCTQSPSSPPVIVNKLTCTPSAQRKFAQAAADLNKSGIENGVLRIFDVLKPWVDYSFTGTPPEDVQEYISSIHSAIQEMAETLACIRDATDRGFAASGEGLRIFNSYREFETREDVVGYTEDMKEALKKGFDAAQKSSSRLHTLQTKLAMLSHDRKDEALRACDKKKDELLKRGERSEMVAIATESLAGTLRQATPSTPIELGVLAAAAPGTSLLAYRANKSMVKQREVTHQELSEYENLSKDITVFGDQIKEMIDLLQPLRDWWFEACGTVGTLEEMLLTHRTSELKVIESNQELALIQEIWVESRARFQAFLPLIEKLTRNAPGAEIMVSDELSKFQAMLKTLRPTLQVSDASDEYT